MRQPYSNELMHYGILGQKWGVRRYQNADGSLTSEGIKRYAVKSATKVKKSSMPVTKSAIRKEAVSELSKDKKIIEAANKLKKPAEELRAAEEEAERICAEPFNAMLKDDEWRDTYAKQRAEESKYPEDAYDYYYNVAGIDAADDMSTAYIDSHPQYSEAKQASSNALKAFEQYERAFSDAAKDLRITDLDADYWVRSEANLIVSDAIRKAMK